MFKNHSIQSSIAAAWLILGKEILPEWPAWPDTVAEILDLTGSGKTQAYQVLGRLRQAVSTLLGKPGRPPQVELEPDRLLAVSHAIQDFLMTHPGAASRNQQRAHYSDAFRLFVLNLVEAGQPGEGLSVSQLASATAIPLGTLKDWFSGDLSVEPVTAEPLPIDSVKDHHFRQIITLYQEWKGTFLSFCHTLRQDHRLNYGATFIGNLLHDTGLRPRKTRRQKESPWAHDTYRKLFPGAQWIGDGSTVHVKGLDVVWGGQAFKFNLEAILDPASNALTGISITDFEDQDAVLSAFADAVSSTGKPPLALSLDNRASNHTQAVQARLGETTLLATTPGRPESKAPIEGNFGLFKQALPEINVAGADPREQAREVLALVFTAWARGRNGKPRLKLGKLSPAQYYTEYRPTKEEIEAANQWIQELGRRQEQFRKTKAERADAAKLAFLKHGLADLEIEDADGRLAVDLAYYGRDAIVNGLSIFRAKRILETLPPGADAPRYLGGIIRNEDHRLELELTAEFFLENRQRLRDLTLRTLNDKAAQSENHPPEARIRIFLERALKAPRAIDYHFWIDLVLRIFADFSLERRLELCKTCARRICTAFHASRERRSALLARLTRACVES